MKINLIPAQHLSSDLVGIWTRLQQANPDLASPYFHPEFTRITASVRHDVQVALLELDGKIAGFFPFQREGESGGRPVGGPVSDYHGLICAQDFQFSPIELLEHCGLRTWDFDHLPTSQLSFAPFQWSVDVSPRIDLSHGYDAYVQERRTAGSEQIKKASNLKRRIEREVGPLRFVADSADAAAFATVLGWKSSQYRQSGQWDLFAPGWIRQLVDRIFATHTDDCSGVLSLLYAGERLVAGHFGMRSRQVWHYWFPSYDLEASKYSPGLILLLEMAEHAPAAGVRVIDLGKGMSLYKQRLANSWSPVASGRLELSGWDSFRRNSWRTLRSRLANSQFGPTVRTAREWLWRHSHN
jgi:CelD/BcsL family acetyltransferase involved in cellulose biosynthesis